MNAHVVNRALGDTVRDVTVAFPGHGEMVVRYRPFAALRRPGMVRRSQALRAQGDPTGALCHLLAGMLVSWDLIDDRGKQVEHTEDALRALPESVTTTVFNAVMSDAEAFDKQLSRALDALPKEDN